MDLSGRTEMTGTTGFNQWLQKGPLFLERQVRTLPLPSARGVNGRRPLAIVALNQIAHGADGQPNPSPNRTCGCRIHQGMAYHQPTPYAPGFCGLFDALINGFNAQMVFNADPLPHRSLAQRSFSNGDESRIQIHSFKCNLVLGCIRVEFKTDALNARSRQALARIGATEEGTFRNHMLMPGGRIRHSVYFSITHDEWPRVKAHLEGLLAAYPAASAGPPSSPSGRGKG
jgi:hypothetical protein